MSAAVDASEIAAARDRLDQVRQEVAQVYVGSVRPIDALIMAMLARGHALLEGVPGVAKTTLVKAFAAALGCTIRRIQFTPDLLPADITGTYVLSPREGTFALRAGPVFANVLLADEINRAPAKTQSALLQAMQERQVSIDRETHPLDPNFSVFATQNPIEYEGTYPLPEAQKDRFMLKISMNVPERDEELTLAKRMLGQDSPEAALASGAVRQTLSAASLAALRGQLALVVVRDDLLAYIVDIVRASRRHESVLVGAGPRATQSLLLAARAAAAIAARDFVTPDDIKAMAGAVLEHRLILRPEFEIEGVTVAEVIQKILQQVAVPR